MIYSISHVIMQCMLLLLLLLLLFAYRILMCIIATCNPTNISCILDILSM
jgi:hypothetical protein